MASHISFLTQNGWLEQDDAFVVPSEHALEMVRLLMVNYISSLRSFSHPIAGAMIQASITRLRPSIYLTAFSPVNMRKCNEVSLAVLEVVQAVVPVVLAEGDQNEIQK